MKIDLTSDSVFITDQVQGNQRTRVNGFAKIEASVRDGRCQRYLAASPARDFLLDVAGAHVFFITAYDCDEGRAEVDRISSTVHCQGPLTEA